MFKNKLIVEMKKLLKSLIVFFKTCSNHFKKPTTKKSLPVSLFEITQEVLHDTERRFVVGLKFENHLNVVARKVWSPVFYIHLGVMQLLKPLFVWLIVWFCYFLASTIYLQFNPIISPENKKLISFLVFYSPLLFIAFALPSTYVFDSITNLQVENTANYIESLGINSEEKIKAFETNIDNVFTRTQSRIKTFQYLLGFSWAIFLFALNQMNNILLKISGENILKSLVGNIEEVLLWSLSFLLSVILIVGYKKANNVVFRRIGFAIQELKYRHSL